MQSAIANSPLKPSFALAVNESAAALVFSSCRMSSGLLIVAIQNLLCVKATPDGAKLRLTFPFAPFRS